MEAEKAKPDVLVSGKTSFKIEVPYKLIETGQKRSQKPLILYLHGYGDNISAFEKRCEPFFEITAYHLFIQGPYPIYDHSGKKSVSKWGRAWYLYDGRKKQFVKSLEITSEFIQEVVDNLRQFINVNRMCVLGYSMGGYLAGYFALTRWKHIHDLIVIGARIKTEIVNESDWKNLNHLDILALHGLRDNQVNFKNQQAEIDNLLAHGISSKIDLVDKGHKLDEIYLTKSKTWLIDKGYQT